MNIKVYAVTDQKGTIHHLATTRESARRLKANLGGKRQGISILQLGATKEVR